MELGFFDISDIQSSIGWEGVQILGDTGIGLNVELRLFEPEGFQPSLGFENGEDDD